MEMAKFVDVNDIKVNPSNYNLNQILGVLLPLQFLLLPIWQSFTRKHQGRLLKYLQKLYEDKLQRDVLEEMLAIAEGKNWNHICSLLKRMVVTANPQGYRLF